MQYRVVYTSFVFLFDSFMKMISIGSSLTATAVLNSTDFENAVIFIHQSDIDGVIGFVVNKVFDRGLNELAEFADSKPILLYDGGPVDKEHLFVLHRRPELITGSRHITGDIFFGGDFGQVLSLLNNGQLRENDIRIFIGYCGWDPGQLEEEIDEGSWQISNTDTKNLFHSM
jgi:putative transcriptional regulator